jgi:ubiquitin-conjugating enzyme E2 O
VDASQRMASVLFTDHHSIEVVSLLELDVNGTADNDVLLSAAMDGLGVHRGDLVFIHGDATTNGFAPPRVPKIGEIEGWVHEQPCDSSHLPLGWRKEMSDLGIKIASERGSSVPYEYEGRPRLAHEVNDGSLLWIGEVTDVNTQYLNSLQPLIIPFSYDSMETWKSHIQME